MPYISAEEVKSMREEIKKTFPEYKFSVTCRHHSTVVVALMEGPAEFEKPYHSVNTYHLESRYKDNPEALKVFKKIMEIIHAKKEWVLHEEETDYGRWPNYYIDIEVGKWDKPYKRKSA